MSRYIFKITDYIPEHNSICVKFSNVKSNVPIDSNKSIAVDLSKLNLKDFELFSDSLIRNWGLKNIKRQEENLKIIDENIPEKINENFNIRDLIGKNIEANYYSRNRYPLKVRRVEI